jgi:hypothetical protein
MSYPTLEQYNEALQNPGLALTDAQLRAGRVRTSGLGIPLALCGGFALTYSIEAGGQRYALRCFHKESPELERRYRAVADRLRLAASPYFLPFDFLPDGIRVHGKTYPVVRMAWAKGETLSEFLEREHGDAAALARLRGALAGLDAYLERERISHGDIQPGNVMVADHGASVRLIDYDGMFVEALAGSRATELGQRNFQHPGRTAAHFGPALDRFAFLALDTALAALMQDKGVWQRSLSEPEAIVFRAQDFADPASSSVFAELQRLPTLQDAVLRLARVARGAFAEIPSLVDFQAGRNIPGVAITLGAGASGAPVAYQGAYPVLSATAFEAFIRAVGDKVELVGQIVGVKRGWGANRRPYVFLNFADWRGNAVKIAVWHDALSLLTGDADTWNGRWVSMTALVDVPFENTTKRGVHYRHVSLTLTQRGQLQVLTEAQARLRLGGAGKGPARPTGGDNQRILEKMGTTRATPTGPTRKPTAPPAPPPTGNQAVLDQMRRTRPAPSPPQRTAAPSPASSPAPSSGGIGIGPILAGLAIIIALLRACTH